MRTRKFSWHAPIVVRFMCGTTSQPNNFAVTPVAGIFIGGMMKRKSLQALARDARASQGRHGGHVVRECRPKKRFRRNRHHMCNQCYGFTERLSNGGENLLRIRVERHAKLHKMFGNMDWESIHNLLNEIFGVGDPVLVVHMIRRVSRAKHRY